MIDFGHVFGGHTDLDHLKIIGRLHHAMADLRRLDKAIPRIQAQQAALVLIKDVDPTVDTEDQLKSNLVKMHHVWNRPTVGDPNMAGNHRTA